MGRAGITIDMYAASVVCRIRRKELHEGQSADMRGVFWLFADIVIGYEVPGGDKVSREPGFEVQGWLRRSVSRTSGLDGGLVSPRTKGPRAGGYELCYWHEEGFGSR